MKPLNGKTILIIDNEEIMRDLIAAELREKGAHILEADNGHDGFKILQSQSIDLVLSDLRMPGWSGTDFLAALKGMPSRPAIIFISGFCDDHERDELLGLGAAAVLEKPFNKKALFNLIIAHL